MPEEKKKESFTFSDKIKNSKPIASKSFANRISSKIGSNGKPKKTLFERTKRDAPFFIAALIALLLLPFLYKYSGQVNEEVMVTPGSEESIFDPERYGFDTVTGDPDGQVALFSGRDPLSWIITGSKSTQPEEDSYDSQIYTDRSGMDDSSSYNDTTVEENNTNIYKQNAPAATRAAFRRAATKINPLSSAGLTSRSGGKLGVGMWGGGLKTAAKKVAAEGPRNSPKPVSLQPLQAAGKPSRTYFGSGAAAEARRSKDAMSKANAMQALMDAQVKPIEPGKFGGLGSGSFSPGGGAGKLERAFAFNGKEPWWWDMMKRRSQMEWEADFNRKWDWIKWKDKLWQNVLGGLFNCIVMGTDDGAPGKFFGAKAGAGSPAKCGGLDKEKWTTAHPDIPFDKDYCRSFYGFKVGKDVQDPWSGGNANEVTLGPIGQRLDCLSEGLGAAFDRWFNKAFGANKGAFGEVADCYTFATNGVYFSSTKGGGWTVLHYVVGVPTDELETYYNTPAEHQPKMLVVGYIGEGTQYNSNLSDIKKRTDFVPLFIESVAIKNKKIKDSSSKEGEKDKAEAVVSIVRDQQLPKYNDFLNVIREGGVIRDAVPVGARENLSKSTKGGKQGKGWITGARCAYPLVRVSCDYYANVSSTAGEQVNGWPFAHLSFANGMVGPNAYNAMKSRFFISYTVQGQDNSQPVAISTSTDSSKGQWYPIPHQNVRPYRGSWNQEATGAGFVTTNLGTERTDLPGKGNDYQVVATAPIIQDLKAKHNRVVVTWEIRQCNDLLIDGSSITQGGCNRGNITLRDKDGNVKSIEGADKPGSTVSQVVCVYEDGTTPFGIPMDLQKKEPEPQPQKKEAPKPDTLYLADYMSGKGGINDLYSSERNGLLQFPSVDVFGKGGHTSLDNAFSDCLDVGYAASQKVKAPAKVFDQANVQAYVSQVIERANQKPELKSALKRFEHTGDVTVSQLVDAMTIDYTMNPSAQVPLNVVCALGKTIGHNSFDRSPAAMRDSRAWRNMLGAFAAYIGPDSSYYPALYVYDASGNQIIDKRFFGCAVAFENGKETDDHSTDPQYHYGRYNWSKWRNGDIKDQVVKNGSIKISSGSTGRDPYLRRLQNGGWTENAWNAQSYPLYPIAQAVGFRRADTHSREVLKSKYNETIDDYNRDMFTKAYRNVLSDLVDSCQLSGNMPVANALKYIGGVCVNGKEAKPDNGYGPNACTQYYKGSKVGGTDTNLTK